MRQRIIVKIGSSSLTQSNGELNQEKIIYFAEEITALRKQDFDVLLVTSGGVAAGFRQIGYAVKPKLLKEKQASAAVGQALLMEAYSKAFALHDCKVAQILLTRANFSNRKQAHNAMMTVEELLNRNVLPIINENDTVSVDELKFGDNDTLSALVANLVKAHQLMIFTDTDGLYTKDPRFNADAERLHQVDQIDDRVYEMAGVAGSEIGTGGMRSKLEAARIAVRGGVSVFVGQAIDPGDMLLALKKVGKGTYFTTQLQKLPIKKQWVGFHSLPKGRITIDEGASKAMLSGGKSLLPAGVIEVAGDFHPGDVIEVFNKEQQLIGKGVVNYTDWQLQASIGLSTEEIRKRLDIHRFEVIHRDEWVTLYG